MLIRAVAHHPVCLPLPIAVAQMVAAPAAIVIRSLGAPDRQGHSQLRTSRGAPCKARRRAVRYDEEDESSEQYGQNLEISLMEAYSEAVRDVALLVRATVDGEEEVVIIFKGFSSRLSSRTSSDPSKSVLPARAVIQSVDVVKGPFDPSNTEYIEKDLTWEAFKTTRLQSKN